MIVPPAAAARTFTPLLDEREPGTRDRLKSSWLTKRNGNAWFSHWRHRYVVLWPDKVTWHETDDTNKIRGEIPLRTGANVTVEGEGLHSNVVLTVPCPVWSCWSTPEKRLELRCTSSEQARAWERALWMTIAQCEPEAGDAEGCVDCERGENTCAICLGQTGDAVAPAVPDCLNSCLGTVAEEQDTLKLLSLRRCGHALCAPCLRKHAAQLQRLGGHVWCPMCRRPLAVQEVLDASDEAITSCMRDDAVQADVESLAPLPRVTTPADIRRRERAEQRAQRQFESAARSMHMKCCPHCRAPIIKDGGCNNMHCRSCNRHFQWDAAPTVFPCRQVHLAKKCTFWGTVWGTVCPGAHPIAKVKLVAIRSGIAILAAPVAALIAAGVASYLVLKGVSAIAFAAVPLAVYGPPALLYHPVHVHLESVRIRQEEAEDERRLLEYKSARARRRWRYVKLIMRDTRGRMVHTSGSASSDGALQQQAFITTWYACPVPRPGLGTFYFSIASPNDCEGRLTYDEARALTGINKTQWSRPESPAVPVRWLDENGQPLLGGKPSSHKHPLWFYKLKVPSPPSYPKPESLIAPYEKPQPRSRQPRPNPLAHKAASGIRAVSDWRIVKSIVPPCMRPRPVRNRGRHIQ